MTLVRNHYVPVLTGKRGEFEALGKLSREIPLSITPLIDMPPIPPSAPPRAGEEVKRESARSRLGRLLDAMERRWGRERRLMVDLSAYDRYDIDGKHPAEWFFREGDRRGLWLMAAIGTDTSSYYRDAIRAVAATSKGLAVRARASVAPDDLADAVGVLAAALPAADPAFSYVLLDLGRTREVATTATGLHTATGRYLRALQERQRPVSALVGTSFPVSSVPRGPVLEVERAEWFLWRDLSDSAIAENVAFGDYGVTGPRPVDDEWRPGPDPHVRYTTNTQHLMWRGRLEERVTDPNDPRGRAVLFPELCRRLVRRREFAKRQFSEGDRGFWVASRDPARPGNSTKWIEFATNHHITHVARELARL